MNQYLAHLKNVQWEQHGKHQKNDVGLMTLYDLQNAQPFQQKTLHQNLKLSQKKDKKEQSNVLKKNHAFQTSEQKDLAQELRQKAHNLYEIKHNLITKKMKNRIKRKDEITNNKSNRDNIAKQKDVSKKALKLEIYQFGQLDKPCPSKIKIKTLQSHHSLSKQKQTEQKPQADHETFQNHRYFLKRKLKHLQTVIYDKDKYKLPGKGLSKDYKRYVKIEYLKQYTSQLKLNNISCKYLQIHNYKGSNQGNKRSLQNYSKIKSYDQEKKEEIQQSLEERKKKGSNLDLSYRFKLGDIASPQMARYLSRERNNTHLHHLNIKRSKPSNVKKGKSSSYRSNLLNTSSKLMPISSVQMPPPLKKSAVEHKQHLKEIIQQYFITKHNRQLRDRKERHLTMI